MRRNYIAPAILILLIGNGAYAAGLSTGEIKARDYSVQGATFGMSLADFESKFSVHKPLKVDPNNQTVTHEIFASEGIVQFEFYRDRLSAIFLIYSFDGLDRVERENAIVEQAIRMFGKPLHSSDGDVSWSFRNVNRNVACGRSVDSITIKVWDTSTPK